MEGGVDSSRRSLLLRQPLGHRSALRTDRATARRAFDSPAAVVRGPEAVGRETGREKRGNGTRCAFDVSRFPFSVEARGIEPRSEHDSDTAPTCVDLALWSHHLGAWSALAVTSLWKLLRQPLRPQLTPARLCDT